MEADSDVLFSDPAGFHWLEGQSDALNPAIALSSAQYLPPDQRRRVSDLLGAPIVNYYSTTETGPVAWECLREAGRFHVLAPDVWVESIDDELAITRLRPSVLPLLRYRLGDQGHVVPDDCTCGYTGWSIREFHGRRVCEFVGPDGESVDAWRLARFFKYRSLDGFRVTQEAVDRFRVELVRADGKLELEPLREQLQSSLERLGWERVTLRFEPVDSLEASGSKAKPFCRADDVPTPSN